ncbi:WLM-domain-containing protein [Didymella exigua CBS 183.55]|uniref:WLM-domain-containing protein n=1 Tax=Didymella exigua CBS 183.55 TaxID=1150837 RepID=A0A6A5RP34_9PLEO|nr:WLM-domain-containing protein [Didymella exigua CBS 183.55]KAF1929080.1 WLM-domain-containing protein [Didymella exigua CBS 183.55]
MPLGFERINERTQRPNASINFIRTIPGPTSMTAEQILNRVAAICYPFMKANMILVQALEEFPYNNEFVGRNFNCGEVIQLVLRDRNGRWLPQRMVEMVMVHELAHCKQMNHSKAFWKVRDAYAVDLRALWVKGYTGEGIWGRGRGLETGNIQSSKVDASDMPEHLCGGTYGRRLQKRGRGGKEKETLSYAERKQRRILKKFGAGGQSLGADDDTKIKLEGGVPKKGKPRVAGSARGRELRAAAALARFEPVKREAEGIIIKKEDISDSGTEDEIDLADAALDVDGSKLVDCKGRALIKICEDDVDKDGDARREMDEIQNITPRYKPSAYMPTSKVTSTRPNTTEQTIEAEQTTKKHDRLVIGAGRTYEVFKRRSDAAASAAVAKSRTPRAAAPVSCKVCSLSNEPGLLICAVCFNVLNPDLMNHWKCKSESCKRSNYMNAGNVGACGACGQPKAAQ